jgi:hypothetical protein
MFGLSLFPLMLLGTRVLFMIVALYVQNDIHMKWCWCRLNSSTTGANSGTGTAYPSLARFVGFVVAQSLVFCVLFLPTIVCHIVFSSFGHCIIFSLLSIFKLFSKNSCVTERLTYRASINNTSCKLKYAFQSQ